MQSEIKIERVNLKEYIKGERRGKEANQLERKAMEDPFLQDAIDGYDSVIGDHISTIDDLEKRFTPPGRAIHKRIWIWAAAAVIVLLIGTPLLLRNPFLSNKPYLAEKTTDIIDIIRSEEESAPSQPSQPVEASSENMELIAEKIIEETVPSPPSRPMEASSENMELIAEKIIEDSDKLFVSGRIIDETGEPLPGVIIQLSNTRSGTVSDTAGNFQLIVPNDEQKNLIASYIGMKNSEIPLKENVGDIMMKADDMALNENVVVAFGSQKKESVVGSVTSGSPSRLKRSRSNAKDVTAENVDGVVYNAPLFDKEDFIEYFTEHYDKDICAGQKISFKVKFYIDPIGQPGQINIEENSCPELEIEIKRLLLGSPPWSKRDRKVTLQIELF